MMDTVLTDLKWQSCLVHLDDVVIFSDTFEEHLKRLRAVFEAIRSAGLSLKPEKCHFAFRELKFLGHIVSAQGVSPDPEKTAAVAAFPQPTDKRSLRCFLGLCTYYRRFVQNFSKLAEPLTRLTKDSEPFFWGQDQEKAFIELKTRLQSTPIVAHFDEQADTELHTDASNVGLGAVIVQWQDGVERVIAYASRHGTAHRCQQCGPRCGDCAVARRCGTRDRIRNSHFVPFRNESDDDCAFLGAVTTSDLAHHQRADCELLPLIEYLEGTTPSPPRLFSRGLSSFCLIDGVLYKKNYGPTDTAYLLVVPTVLRKEVLAACHDDLSSGHLGFSRTLGRLRHKYYWPRLAAVVQRYVRTCRECQRRKVPPTKPAGLLKPIDPPQIPFQQVGMDLLGLFPVSSMGNQYIVVATDYLSRYCETKALPRGTAVGIAQFFVHHIVLRHGAHVVVITDRGTAFTSALTHEVLRLSGTSHRKTTAYHPQTNGLTERLDKTITDMMSMYVDADHRNWDEILPYITFAYNTALQETTRFTPFRLVYGRDALTMLDAMLLPDCTPSSVPGADQFVRDAEAAHHFARQSIRHQQTTDARRYNLRHREVIYQPGEHVWVWSPIRVRGRSKKLLRRYFGPYEVLRQLSDVNYEVYPQGVVRSSRPPKSEVVHVSRMKPYYAR
ncbi:hypothetical protein V5799_024968 [Amblyomma americanum]|uniref:RNA-directed DNA polymerase n=1 Tax=Amblyomma americanum TaxID=6943 RepID=A0AAQ4EAM0_AMBAM